MYILIIVLFFLLSVPLQQSPPDFDELQPITAQNAAQLKQVANLGMGRGGMPYWSADGHIVFYPTTAGVWEYRLDNLAHPTLFDISPIPKATPDVIPTDLQQPIAVSPDKRYKVFQESLDADNREAILWVEDTITGTRKAIRANGVMWRTYSAIPLIPRFSETGLLFARDDQLFRWNINTDTEELLIPAFIDLSISPSGQYAAGYAILPSVDIPITLHIWDLETAPAKLMLEQNFPGTDLWHSLAFSPDGKFIATGGNNNNVRIWDIANRGMTFTDDYPPDEMNETSVVDLAYSPDGRYIAGCVNTVFLGHAFLREAATGIEVATIYDRVGSGNGYAYFNSVAFDPTGKIVAFGGGDGNILLWPLAELIRLKETDLEHAPRVFQGHTAPIIDIRFSPDGKMMATASWDKTVRLWDYQTGQMLRVLDAHDSRVWSAAFDPNGKLLATSAEDGTVRLWDLSTYEHSVLAMLPKSYFGDQWAIVDLTFSPEGSVLAGSYRAGISIWDVEQQRQVVFLDIMSSSWHIAFNASGTLLASASQDTTVRLWGIHD